MPAHDDINTMKQAKVVCLAVLCAAGWLLPAGDCWAGARHKVVERTDKPPVSFLPSALAREELDAPVLSGLDYTAIAPPGTRLRIIEDEPYIYVRGNAGDRLADNHAGLSRITLLGSTPSGGSYEAQVSLRVVPGISCSNELRLAFDTAANYAYSHTLVTAEQRGDTAYALNEVRSPLGLTNPADRDNQYREYLVYSAAIANPQDWHAAGEQPESIDANRRAAASADSPADESIPAESQQVIPATPYLFVQGQLKVLRRIARAHCLLTIDITAQDFPHSLTLTENLARCIINRIDPASDPPQRLDYLVYYPEYEPFIPYFEGETAHPAAADLAERPAEGCGEVIQPITGDVCPQCQGEEGWPAMPYSAEMTDAVPDGQELPICSKCLYAEDTPEQSSRTGERCKSCESGEDCAPCRERQAKCSPCRAGDACASKCSHRCKTCGGG